jgi:transcriptional regulator with GAF, ATPase, and Fis domain
MLTDNQMGQPQKSPAAEQQILVLGRVLQSLREAEDIDVLIATTIAYLKQQFDYQVIWIALYDRLNNILLGKGGFTPDRDTSVLQRRLVIKSGDILEQVVTEQCPLGVTDLRRESRATEWQAMAAKYEIQGTIFLPIRYKDKCLGVVLLGSKRWGYLLAGEAREKLLIVIGELGVMLHQNHIDLQQQQAKSPNEALIRLLENVRNLNQLDKRLEAVVQATHQFVSPSRTNIYWLEREGRYFWCRMSNHLVNMGRNYSTQQAAVGITVQELSDFYYALAVNEVVWISESSSSLKSHFRGKLLQRLGMRSLLAAPILWQKDLLGFLAVEGYEPRLWLENEKNFVQGAAGLISLLAPTESMENTLREIHQHNQLTSQVTQGIYNEQDLDATLHLCASQILEQLAATRFILLHYNPDKNNYQIFYQRSPQNRRSWSFTLDVLSAVDWQLLENATQAVEIENYDDDDLRFANWRQLLLGNGVRSLLICNCAQGRHPDALLLIAHETHRSWTTLEKELLWVFSQQLGLIVHHWQLLKNHQQQQKISQIFTQCLNILAKNYSTKAEVGVLEKIASLLECPLAALLTWFPGQIWVEVTPMVLTNHRLGIVTNLPVSIEKEALLQAALAEDGYLSLRATDLSPDTRRWLHVPDGGQVLVIALRTTANYQPTGVVILADSQERHWSELSLDTAVTLISQLAWWRRQQQISQRLESTTEELQKLNWYKHRRVEEIQRMTALLLGQMNDLGIPTNELTLTRYQLLLRQLDQTTASMKGMLKLEQWQLHLSWETMSVASLLKRSLERVENILKQQRLRIGVHGLGQPHEDRESTKSYSFLRDAIPSANQSPIVIAGDIVKIELVIYELLVAACHRSQSGDRIDLWCRRLDERLLELSITDNGIIEPQLLAELHHHSILDVLAISTLDKPPGLHLLICQKLMQHLGGELNVYELPDHRIVNRLLLPLAPVNTQL